MAAHYRPILPAQSADKASKPVDSAETQKRRSTVLVACRVCQKAKSKCSGDRPICYRCSVKKMHCEYDIEPNQTRASSRRGAEEQLRELYTYLQLKSWSEALEILKRIRETPDPLDVVRLVKAADLLLHKTVLEDGEDITEPRDQSTSYPNYVRLPSSSRWTTITDNDTVQTLINVFFENDQRFLMSFIDRDMFLRGMQETPQQPQNGSFCSTLLVNAICAITACHCKSTTGVNFMSRRDLGEAFFLEAKDLCNLEAGKPSLSTAQALLIMYSYSCRMGRDRAGNKFRASGYEMIEQMMPKIRIALSNTDYPAINKQAVLIAIWGIFCFDSICSSVYLRPSLFPAPDVPRPFSHLDEGPFFHSGLEPEEVAYGRHKYNHMTLRFAYDLSEISNKVSEHIVRRDSPEETRTVSLQLAQLYRELQTLQSRLPEEEGYQGEHSYEHCHLWAYHHLVAVNIARLLQRWNCQLLSPLGSLTDVCFRHCESMIKHIDRHLSRHPSERQSSLTAVYFAYNCTVTLLDLVGTSLSVVQTFSRACQIFYEATEYPLSNLLLEGLAAAANQLGVQLPTETVLYFSKLNLKKENIPLGFVIPIRGRLFKPLNDGAWDFEPEEVRIELGDVLARSKGKQE